MTREHPGSVQQENFLCAVSPAPPFLCDRGMQNRHDALPEPDALAETNTVPKPDTVPKPFQSRSVPEGVPPPGVSQPKVSRAVLQAAADVRPPVAETSLNSPWLEFWCRVHALALELDAGAETKDDS